MRPKLLIRTLASFAASAAFAVSAQAVGVAGWDFSQYYGAGLLSTDGATFTNTLSANYSNLDPSFNAGPESAPFGTMYMNGAFNSTNVNPEAATPEFYPTTGSLASNLAFAAASNPFDSHTILLNESPPQTFAEFLSMTATAAVSVVFQADLSSIPEQGANWSIVFGGQTFSGGSTVGVEFSTNGSSYTSFGSVNLTAVDTPFTVALGIAPSDLAFVRLSFAAPGAGGAGQAIIDNVTLRADIVPIPEPGTAAMLLVGLVGLARAGRRQA
jgi:hypothetical protein